ncbi:hypothetical protein CC80DRAFT_24335 [Byssothecium circinans]|uniref:Uncharacterized protein n=1 Tax=Byssothecium circinans TaxID=147558 RepID=A0A6A5T6X9_9PLEO|nr:hypothetical protein CC80DRAFT_317867 [Byssothecium circinans]KAF1959017.1 hypothetical protein CC80DRAFT_24335 [Byssothecium circinans]
MSISLAASASLGFSIYAIRSTVLCHKPSAASYSFGQAKCCNTAVLVLYEVGHGKYFRTKSMNDIQIHLPHSTMSYMVSLKYLTCNFPPSSDYLSPYHSADNISSRSAGKFGNNDLADSLLLIYSGAIFQIIPPLDVDVSSG